MTTPVPAAVLWDMDGTLVDTEPYWMRAETELVESFGGTWTTTDALRLVGLGLGNAAAILQEAGVDLPVNEIIHWQTTRVSRQLAEDGIPWRPGARQLLADLNQRGIRCALVTMSLTSMAEGFAAAVGFEAFETIVAGDMVRLPKPDPEAYLLAADRLGVAADRCVALEDSLPGVAAAVASGAVTIGVPHMVALNDSGAREIWPSLSGRSADDVVAAFSRAQDAVA